MANFFILVVFALIGSIFGPIGFIIGFILGVLAWIGNKKDKKPAKPLPVQSAHPFHPVTPRIQKPPELPIVRRKQEYEKLAAQMYAYILCVFSGQENSRVDAITEQLRRDGWISNKLATLEAISKQIPDLHNQRRDSPILFQLRGNSLLEQLRSLPLSMKDRLITQLKELANEPTSEESEDFQKVISKFLHGLQQEASASKLRTEAEQIIMQSGDRQAIGAFQAIQNNPSRYKEFLKPGANQNPVLKTAFGVLVGMLAAEAVKAAIHSSNPEEMDSLLTQLDQEIADAGGLDNIPLPAPDSNFDWESLQSPDSLTESTSELLEESEQTTVDDEGIPPDQEEESVDEEMEEEDDSEESEGGSFWDIFDE